MRDADWRLLDALRAVAGGAGRPMARAALHWAATQPGVAGVLVGATRPEQLDANLAALDFALGPALRARLDAASAPEPGHPYELFSDATQAMVTGGARLDGWAARRGVR